MSSPITPIDIGIFRASAVAASGTLRVTCFGEGDASALGAVDQLLREVHASAVEARVSEVVFDLRTVSFMNSSCFTKFVGWVTRVRELPEDARYRICLQSNQELLWQRRSLHALKHFATDLITIEG